MPSLLASNQIQQIIQGIDSTSFKNPVRVEGIPDAFKAFLISCLFQELDRSVLILAPTSEEAEKFINNLQFFFTLSGLSEEVYYFPSLEIIPYEQVELLPALFPNEPAPFAI